MAYGEKNINKVDIAKSLGTPGRMNFAVVIELLCFLVDVNLDRGKGELDDNC